MTTTREQAIGALFTILATAAEFKTVGRRNRDPEGLAPSLCPALFLLEHSETYKRPSPNLAPIRTMHLSAVVYHDVGTDENAIPSAMINNILDQVDILLKPDDPMRNAMTLGGLVSSVVIDGENPRAPGDITGKSLAIVQIKITLP